MNHIYHIALVIGVPAFIYTWFADMGGSIDEWKNIILAIIAISGGCAFAGRQLLKFTKEAIEFIRWAFPKKPKKNRT